VERWRDDDEVVRQEVIERDWSQKAAQNDPNHSSISTHQSKRVLGIDCLAKEDTIVDIDMMLHVSCSMKVEDVR
jgi:hypothetical protein